MTALPSASADTSSQEVTLEVISGGLRIDLTAPQFPQAPPAVAFVRDHRGSPLNWGMTATFRPYGPIPPGVATGSLWSPRCALVNDTDDVITRHQVAESRGATVCTSTHGDDGISSNVVAVEPAPVISGLVTIVVY